MNLSAAVMLFEENGVRPCQVEYDPDIKQNNNPNLFFKCVDPSVEKGDLVIVQTDTRHGFTVVKVKAIGYADVPVDFENTTRWGWIAAKFDKAGFDAILKSEQTLVGKVSEANANKLRDDLKRSMGLNQVSLADVFIKAPAAIASPHGAPQANEAIQVDAAPFAPRAPEPPPVQSEGDYYRDSEGLPRKSPLKRYDRDEF